MRTLVSLAASLALPSPAVAAETSSVRTGATAFGDWRTDAPGVVRLIRPGDLPPPFATSSASNGPQDAPLPKAPQVRVPDGLAASLWAKDLTGPRTIRVAPNGDVFVAETDEGDVRVIRPATGTGAAGPARVYAKGLEGPFGMAFYPPGDDPRWLYVATADAVFRFPYRSGDLAGAKPEPVLDLGISDGGHSTRDAAFSPDGRRMFVSVGSQSKRCREPSCHRMACPWGRTKIWRPALSARMGVCGAARSRRRHARRQLPHRRGLQPYDLMRDAKQRCFVSPRVPPTDAELGSAHT